jgi:hypothetical protein
MLGSHAAVIPYTNDFSGAGNNTAFPNSGGAGSSWALSGGALVNTSSGTTTASTSSIQLTNLDSKDFTITTQFTVTSGATVPGQPSEGNSVGFGAFGATAHFAGSGVSTAYYLADFTVASTNNEGNLRILSLGNTAGFSSINGLADANPGTSGIAIDLNTTYTLKLTGVYSSGTLNMTFSLFDASGLNQIGTSATASDSSPLTGTYFGYRDRTITAQTTNFDNYSVIPEPGVTGLLLGGFGLAIALRRKSRNFR